MPSDQQIRKGAEEKRELQKMPQLLCVSSKVQTNTTNTRVTTEMEPGGY